MTIIVLKCIDNLFSVSAKGEGNVYHPAFVCLSDVGNTLAPSVSGSLWAKSGCCGCV